MSEAVTIPSQKVLDLLTSLVDASLVVYEEQPDGTGRYRLLETTRQYAGEKLKETGEETVVRERHQAFFVALAEEAEPLLKGPEQAGWLHRLEREHDNLRAALDFQAATVRLRLVAALWWFWYLRGYLSEGRQILAEVLKESIDFGQRPARAKALHGMGSFAQQHFERESAQMYYAESLAIYRELGDNRGAADSLNIQGFLAIDQGNHRNARELFEESLFLGRELGDKWLIANSLNGLGSVTSVQGDYVEARTFYEDSTTLFRDMGDQWGVGWSLQGLGMIALSEGDYAAAYTFHEDSLAIMRKLGSKGSVALSLYGLGTLARHKGDYAAAYINYQESLAIRRELEDTQGIAASLLGLGDVARHQGDCVTARMRYEESLVLQRELEDKHGIACALEAFAALASVQKQAKRAAILWGAAGALREHFGAPLPPNEREEYESKVAALRRTMTYEAFAAAWSEGRSMTMQQAMDYALAEAGDV